jgi:hypothetical protein
VKPVKGAHCDKAASPSRAYVLACSACEHPVTFLCTRGGAGQVLGVRLPLPFLNPIIFKKHVIQLFTLGNKLAEAKQNAYDEFVLHYHFRMV